jgi:hypothetical protein
VLKLSRRGCRRNTPPTPAARRQQADEGAREEWAKPACYAKLLKFDTEPKCKYHYLPDVKLKRKRAHLNCARHDKCARKVKSLPENGVIAFGLFPLNMVTLGMREFDENENENIYFLFTSLQG